MIVTAFLNIVYSFVFVITAPLRLFSNVSLPAALTTSLTTAGEYLTAVQQFFPITAMLSVLAFVLSVEVAIGIYKGIMWLIKRIPTQS